MLLNRWCVPTPKTAARRGILDNISKPESPLLSHQERFAVWACVISVAVFCFTSGAVIVSMGGFAPVFPTQACGEIPPPQPERGLGTLFAVIGLAAMFGVYAVCISLALIDWFARNAAGPQPRWLQLCARSAFAAYLIHPWVLVAAQWAYVAGVVSCFGGRSEPSGSLWPQASDGVPPSGACLAGPDNGSGVLLWVGFFFTAVVALVGSFAFGTCLVRIPGLSRVL
jgi:hypothetical protein